MYMKGKSKHAEGGWPTKQFLHMLLGIGDSGAGHHKARVRVVAALTQPAKPPQDKGSVTSKHSPAQRPSCCQARSNEVTQGLDPKGCAACGLCGKQPSTDEMNGRCGLQTKHADSRSTGSNAD